MRSPLTMHDACRVLCAPQAPNTRVSVCTRLAFSWSVRARAHTHSSTWATGPGQLRCAPQTSKLSCARRRRSVYNSAYYCEVTSSKLVARPEVGSEIHDLMVEFEVRLIAVVLPSLSLLCCRCCGAVVVLTSPILIDSPGARGRQSGSASRPLFLVVVWPLGG